MAIGAAVTLVALLSSTGTALAGDAYPCASASKLRTFTWHGRTWTRVSTQTCPLARGGVPVYAWSSKAAPVVGRLVNGGSANWFVVQKRSNPYSLGRDFNNWWASTRADNGRWGWVNEVYFKGGRNNERDGRLLLMGGFRCVAPCTEEDPPWWQS